MGNRVQLIRRTLPTTLQPKLKLDFLNGSLDPRITFTRASSATFFGSDGLLKTQQVNLFSNSASPNYTNNSGGGATQSFSYPEAGVLEITKSGSAGYAEAVRSENLGGSPGGSFTISSQVEIMVVSGDPSQIGFGIAQDAPPYTPATDSLTSLGVNQTGVWFRISNTKTLTTAAGSTSLRLCWVNLSNAGSFVVRVRRPQAQLGTMVSEYVQTTGTPVGPPRFDFDPATAAGTVGAELVTNGDFSNGTTGWVVPATVSISGGVANFGAGGGIARDLRNTACIPVAGKTYQITFNVSNATSGLFLNVYLGAVPSFGVVIGASNGQKSVTIRAGNNTELVIQNDSGSTGTCTIDDVSVREVAFTPRGLLIEESRTNLLLHSRDMTNAAWTKTNVTPTRNQVGLDGAANTACLMTEGVAGTANTTQIVSGITAGSTVTYSVILKRGNTDWTRLTILENSAFTDGASAWFNLATGAAGTVTAAGAGTLQASQVTNLGGGWYRCSLTVRPNGTFTGVVCYLRSTNGNLSGTPVNNATYILDCAQLEVGSFATSIIPTTTATVTRAADSASMTGTNFSSWFNGTPGTFVVNYTVGSLSTTPIAIGLSGNGFNSNSAGSARWWNGVSNVVAGTSDTTTNVLRREAAAYTNTSRAITLNGGAVGSDASAPWQTLPTQMELGANPSFTGQFINGHIRSIRYWPRRLSNAQLQALTR